MEGKETTRILITISFEPRAQPEGIVRTEESAEAFLVDTGNLYGERGDGAEYGWCDARMRHVHTTMHAQSQASVCAYATHVHAHV